MFPMVVGMLSILMIVVPESNHSSAARDHV